MKVLFCKNKVSRSLDHQTWNDKKEDFTEDEHFIQLDLGVDARLELTYIGFERGRSSLNIVWQCVKTKNTYRSGMKLLDDVLKEEILTIDPSLTFINNKGELDCGFTITGTFKFKKQGTVTLLTNA